MIASLGKNLDNKDKSKVVTIAVHVLLLLLALWPFLQASNWVEEKGVMVEFSEVVVTETESENSGNSNNNPRTPISNTAVASAPIEVESNATPLNDDSRTVVQEVSEVVKTPIASKEKNTSQGSNSIKEKRNFSSLFTSPDSDDSDVVSGNPDVNRLEGLSSITSTEIGHGLHGRQIVFAPEIDDNSQKTGRVIVRICVDANGKVTSSDFTQRGSSTTDSYLVNKAVEAAWKWRFSTSELAKQCGLITIDFELK